MAHEKAGLLYGNRWEAGSVITPPTGNAGLKDVIRTAGTPGPNGKALPSFIGGSDLAVVARSKVQDPAKEFIADCTSEKNPAVLVMSVWLLNFTTQRGTDYGALMAGSILIALPVVIFFLFVQRKVASGLTAGAVKG